MARKGHLRDATHEPAPALIDPIDSVTAAVLRGTPLDLYQQSLLVAARALDDSGTSAVAKAALLNRIADLRREIDALERADEEEAREREATPDEDWDAAAI